MLLGPIHMCKAKSASTPKTGDWDFFLGPLKQARTEKVADYGVLRRRELPGVAGETGNPCIFGILIVSFQIKSLYNVWIPTISFQLSKLYESLDCTDLNGNH